MAAKKLFSYLLLMTTLICLMGYMAEAEDGPANAPAPCVGTLCMNDDDGICPEGFVCCRQGECEDGQGVCCDNPCDVYPCHDNDGCDRCPWRPTCQGLNDDSVCGEDFGYCDDAVDCNSGELRCRDDGPCRDGFVCCDFDISACGDGQGVCCDNPCDVYGCMRDDDCNTFPGRPTCHGLNVNSVCGEVYLGYCDA